ncbi:MAG: hypothetical protein JJT76_16680 [Clostridiaceae bacterium]|nr:hypothetical protein [Clostridiaceae bacterium]
MANSLTKVVMENILSTSHKKDYKKEPKENRYNTSNNLKDREEALLKNVLHKKHQAVALEDLANNCTHREKEKRVTEASKARMSLEDLALQVKKSKL